MDRLATMRTFVAVVREGSYTAAAKRLGISTKLASKHVQDLETDLRTQLLNRTTRSVSLTDVGRAYLERCRPILEQVDELDSLVRERQGALAGVIRMTAPNTFGSTRLSEALAPFLTQNPEVEIDLRLTDARVALVEEGFDLALRIGVLRDSTLMMRRLSPMPIVVCAAPGYLDRRGRPRSPQALAGHECLIDENFPDARIWRFRRGPEEVSVEASGSMRVNSPGAAASMAAAGLGITRTPLYVADEALADGRLERLLPEWSADGFQLYALYPPNRHLTSRVRALIDHLARVYGDRWR